jgi:multidrug transporter EmrE-like cation transporter
MTFLSSNGTKLAWWQNPYLHIVLAALQVTVSEVCLKHGANQTEFLFNNPWLDSLGIASLASWWVWGGIVFYLGSFVSWLHVLRYLPLNVAFNLVNIEHVFIPLACAAFLGEHINLLRWSGIGLVLLGVWVIAKPLILVEEKL